MSQTPTAIGKYQIIREIARSNDIVYEAYDPLMDRRVALKELSIPNGSTPQQVQDRIERFEREARAAGRLAHPNIMTVYDVGSDGDRHYMAMEFLDGHNLRNELDTKGFVEFNEAIDHIKAVLEGLEHAHANGVVHRDIKPDNIQLTSNGIKITDFGIARLTFQPNLTIDGQVFGTPSYMSPEQIRGGEIDARSDIFSAGVVLYEMISGQKPFQGDNVIAITHAILNSEPVQPKAASYPLWQVLQRALDKSPGLRFSSAKDMREALDQATSMGDGLILPMGSPAGAAAQPYVNPYAPPVIVAPPQAPPATYGYNPYIPGPHQTGPQPTPTPLPTIYYPPPPRRPLLKPETQATMTRVFFIFIIMATFFGMLVAAMLYFTDSMPSAASSEEQKIQERVMKEAGFSNEYALNMYEIAETTEIGSDAYRSKGQEALNLLEMARTSELDSPERQSYLEKAANAYLEQARMAAIEGMSDTVRRNSLHRARRFVPPGTQLSATIEQEVQRIG